MEKKNIDTIRYYMLLISSIIILAYSYFKETFKMDWMFYVVILIMIAFNFILWILEKRVTNK